LPGYAVLKNRMTLAAPILLAEDSEDDLLLMRRAFEKAGLANPLYVVRDGVQAIDYLSAEGQFANRDEYPFPALLLLDLKMPRLSGLDVLQWIRRRAVLASLPVVVLSASQEPIDVNRCYELGARSYLVKPGSFERLVELIKEVVGTYGLTGQWRPGLGQNRTSAE
jgi:CheY-like chemotaxis protein